jgi:large subunit ribosomal protein L10
MAREVKGLMLEELASKFQNVRETGCILVHYQGLKAGDAINARRLVAEHGGRMAVVKNSLFALAMDRYGAGQVRTLLDGPMAVITADNPVNAAKAARQAIQLYQALQMRGAFVDGAVLEAAAADRLADIPSREVLLSQIAGALLAPLRRLAYALLARPRELANCVDQLRERKEGAQQTPQAE